jgi:hypothetical protein
LAQISANFFGFRLGQLAKKSAKFLATIFLFCMESGSKLAQFQQLAKNGSILAENQPIFWLNF